MYATIYYHGKLLVTYAIIEPSAYFLLGLRNEIVSVIYKIDCF